MAKPLVTLGAEAGLQATEESPMWVCGTSSPHSQY